MVLLDINILIYAHRADSVRHREFRHWVEALVSSGESYSIPSLVRSGFLRIVTHPRASRHPTSLEDAFGFLDEITARPNHVETAPGSQHWRIFRELCGRSNAKGNAIPDAYLAALAMEQGGEWITADADFARFHGLRWRHPLDSGSGASGKNSIQERPIPYRVRKNRPRRTRH